jgi:hypothetical protein
MNIQKFFLIIVLIIYNFNNNLKPQLHSSIKRQRSQSPVITQQIKRHRKIRSQATRQFRDTRGFHQTMDSTCPGRFFELESALYASSKDEEVDGLNLTIIAFDKTDNPFPIIFLPDGRNREFRPTQIDVSTDKHWIESKGLKKPAKSDRYLYQFKKEQDVLNWLKSLNNELEKDTACIATAKTKKGKPCLVVNGILTGGMDIYLTNSWIDEDLSEHLFLQPEIFKQTYKQAWLKFIKSLCKKEHIVYFKRGLTQKLKETLDEEQISYFDGEIAYIKSAFSAICTCD